MYGTPLLRWQFHIVHESLDAEFDSIMGGFAAVYARVTICEDAIVNGVLARGKPLAFSSWLGRTGLSELPPLANPTERRAWTRRVRIEPVRFRAYARAVHAATEAYLSHVQPLAGGETQSRVLLALLLKMSTFRREVATLQHA